MKAAVVHVFGETPRFEDFAEPVASEGETLVKVVASGIHPIVRTLVAGTHYGSGKELPIIPGIDGVGYLDNGNRVYFSLPRAPYGALAERTVVSSRLCVSLPEQLDSNTVAAIFNPGIAAWLALYERAKLQPGETVLILGATGASGQLAVQLAKLANAGKIIATGRNPQILEQLLAQGVDVAINLAESGQVIGETIAREIAGSPGIVIIDYLWGQPTELVIEAISRKGLNQTAPRVRLIEVGATAGATINLPAAVLRSSGLEVYGSGIGTFGPGQIGAVIPQFLEQLGAGKIGLAVETAALSEIETAWQRRTTNNARLVILPQ